MLAFLALGFLADYMLDRVVPGEPLPYYWSAFLCLVVFGASFVLFTYFSLHKEWLTHGTAIAYVITGGLLLLWTPVLVSLMQKYPNLQLPGFTPRSYFVVAALLVAVTGVYTLLPKPKKRKK
jgi:hypothetical protein